MKASLLGVASVGYAWTRLVGVVQGMPLWQRLVAVVVLTTLVVAAGAGIATAVSTPQAQPAVGASPTSSSAEDRNPLPTDAAPIPPEVLSEASPSPSATPAPSPTAEPTSSPRDSSATNSDIGADPYGDLPLTGRVRCEAVPDESFSDVAAPFYMGESGPGAPHRGDTEHVLARLGLGALAPYDVIDIQWAPDSSRAAVVTGKGASQVWLVDPDGEAVLVSRGQQVEELSPVRWSPDARHLLYVTVDTAGGHQLQRADARDGTVRTVVSAQRFAGYAISTDGDVLVASSTGRGRMAASSARLERVDTTTGARTFVASAGFPAVSPDGSTVAVFGDVDSDGRVGPALIDLETLDYTEFGPDVAYDGYLTSYFDRHTAAWSPDGTHVAAVAGTEKNRKHATVIVATSAGELVVRENLSALYRPAWLADSSAVAATDRFTLVSVALDGSVARVAPLASAGGIVVTGSAITWRASLCGDSVWRSIVFDSQLDAAAAVPTASGWTDAGLPHSAPDGSATIRLLVGPDGEGPGLYMMAP